MEAERACERAKSLTEQLRTFAKGEAANKKVGAIGPLLREAVEFALRGTNVGCEFCIPADLKPVEFDEGRMSQVFNNLVINAQQAMLDGGVVGITAENVTLSPDEVAPLPQGRYVKIAVRDHGTGIPEEHLSRVFDPYFTTKKGGSGLGLATSYSIIKGHEGLITVESQVSAGTAVYVYLPASEKELLPQPALQPVTRRQGKGRVLVMDDEEMVRDVVAEMIQLMGYDVQCAGDGHETLAQYKKAMAGSCGFDCVIMNLTIPGKMGAKDAVAELLRLDPFATVVVTSGHGQDPVMGDYASYGFKGVVSKPYNFDELQLLLQRVMDLPPTPESGQRPPR
jgi:two-component system, cell cycle sensor histidine kinase and response regulator CckA